MKVGVKYCGGCNPEYRREDVEDVLRKHFTIFYSEDADSPVSEEELLRRVLKAMRG